MTRARLKELRRPATRRRRIRIFAPFVLFLGPLLLIAGLTFADPNTSIKGDVFQIKAHAIAARYGAIITSMVPFKTINLAIPDDLTNDTDLGCEQAAQLFHELCSLDPNLQLQVFRQNPEFIRNPAPGPHDAGEQFIEVHQGIPSSKNPMTLAWTTVLVNGDPYE